MSAISKPTKTLLIFDVDGTLLYSDGRDSQCFADTFAQRYQTTFPSIDWSTFPHVTDDTIFKTAYTKTIGNPPTLAEMNAFKSTFGAALIANRQKAPHLYREVNGSRRLIEQLTHSDDYLVGTGTGSWHVSADIKLKHIGINPHHLLMGTADGNETRENIINGVIRAASEKANITDIIYIGDEIWDVTTTRNMQLKLIGLRRKGDFDYLSRYGVSQVLSDFADMNLFFNTLRRATIPKN